MAFNATRWFKTADRGNWQDACNTLEEAFFFGFYGAFQDTTTQAVADVTAAYPMTLNTTDESYGVTVSSASKITVANPGTYNLQWSGQYQNSDNTDHDATVWIRKGNGGGSAADITGSAGVISIPASHGQVSGHTVAGWNWVFTLAANDYLTLMWSADSTAVTLQAYAAQTSPTRPSTASVVVTMTQVGAVR